MRFATRSAAVRGRATPLSAKAKDRMVGPCMALVALGGGLVLPLLSGCQHGESFGQPDEVSRKWREQADAAVGRELPAQTEAPGLGSQVIAAGEPEPERAARPPLPGTLVENLVMAHDVDLAYFLRALARVAEVNLLVGEHVSGPIRLSLPQSTSWDRLFQMIVDAHALHYEWDGELLRVFSAKDIERQIAVEKALLEREQARDLRRRAEPLELELYRVRYADATRLAESIKAGLAGGRSDGLDGVSVIPDTDSGILILHAPPSRMERVKALALNLDQPARQILIEATIVQTNSETARDLGFQWGAAFIGRDGGKVDLGTSIFSEGWNANFPADIGPEGPGFVFGAIRSSPNQILQAQLSALQKDGRLRIVSTPSITTLDKQTALIESGEERPFQSASGSGATTTSTVEFKRAVLSLEVTPQVINGQWIKLNIKTTKDDFDESRPIIIEGTLQLPILTRAANTILYLADGQTTVIGGLSSQIDNDGQSGIPGLKDLPLVGPLFRNTTARTAFSDTLIFITPRILPATQLPAPAGEASR